MENVVVFNLARHAKREFPRLPVVFSTPRVIEKIKEWCREHLSGRYADLGWDYDAELIHGYRRKFAFADVADAVLFKLMWC